MFNTLAEHQERSLSSLGLPDAAGSEYLGFCEIAKPLFKATAGSGKDPLEWEPEREKAFEEIKRLVTSTPALGLRM